MALNTGSGTSSFQLTPEQEAAKQQAEQERAQAAADLVEKSKNGFGVNGAVQGAEAYGRMNDAQRKVDNAVVDAQSQNAGVQRADVQQSAGGISGFFGGKETGNQYTAGSVKDTTTDANQANLQARIAELKSRGTQTAQAATMGPTAQAGQVGINMSPQDQFRAQQMALGNQLALQAAGQGPSAAQAQLQAGSEQNLANALAQAATYRGGNAAAGFRQAAMQRAQITQGTANQAAQLRAQEQLSAQQQLGGVLAQGRATDADLATQQAGLTQQTNLANAGFQQQGVLQNNANQQQTNLANLGAGVQQQQNIDAQIQALMQTGMTLDQARQAAQIQQQQFNAGLLAQQEAARNGIAVQNNASAAQAGGAFISALGTAAIAASDMNVKKNIEDGSKDTRSFLEAISPKKYEYTEDKYGQGKYLGFLAQDMEKSKMGKEMVMEVGGVKHIDTWKALSAALASLADMHGRVKKLEK